MYNKLFIYIFIQKFNNVYHTFYKFYHTLLKRLYIILITQLSSTPRNTFKVCEQFRIDGILIKHN